MTELKFIKDGWIEGYVDDADERATYTRLKIVAGNAVLTRAFSKRGGGETEALNLPIFSLTSYIARLWWPLLYEPLRAHESLRVKEGEAFLGRHRLDLPMHGDVFPSLGLCSAGDDAVLIEWALLENEYSPLRFLTLPPKEPLQLSRESVELELMDLVESALARLNSGSSAHAKLDGDWNRVKESLGNPAQASYCMAAGRLGIDPYDPEAPDIGRFAENLPEDLFKDISEAIDVSNLANTTEWTLQAKQALDSFPTIDVEAFGEPPRDDLRITAGEVGFHAAKALRARLGLGDNPRKAVVTLLGGTAAKSSVLAENGPAPVTGLTHRTNGLAHIGTLARSARQRHFRASAAAYIAWCSQPGDIRAGTVAFTRRQQASRAFAAELVAPRSYLFERGGKAGFTEEDIEEVAGDLVAPHDTVYWQALRGGVPLLDVEPRQPRQSSFF
ncbi:MAG: hypothetical protein WAL59_31100 [Roseiarcus sp.]